MGGRGGLESFLLEKHAEQTVCLGSALRSGVGVGYRWNKMGR